MTNTKAGKTDQYLENLFLSGSDARIYGSNISSFSCQLIIQSIMYCLGCVTPSYDSRFNYNAI